MASISSATKLALAKARELVASDEAKRFAKQVAPVILARIVANSAPLRRTAVRLAADAATAAAPKLLGRVAVRAGLGGFLVPLLVPVAISLARTAVARRAHRNAI